MKKLKLIGPFKQLVTMTDLPLKGALSDEQLTIIDDAGMLIEDGKILAIGLFKNMVLDAENATTEITTLQGDHVCLPGFIDAHTHICFGGSRAKDYAMRNAGKTYLEIAKAGGGIWDTVTQTRKASTEELIKKTIKRTKQHLKNGVTTLEVKSGYGLSVSEELKMLRAIKYTNVQTPLDLIPTCLAAHMKPKDFLGTNTAYLEEISSALFPILKEENLSNRIDAFIEESAFSKEEIRPYFKKAQEMDFDIDG